MNNITTFTITNTEAVSKALLIRINDIYEQTKKWKASAQISLKQNKKF